MTNRVIESRRANYIEFSYAGCGGCREIAVVGVESDYAARMDLIRETAKWLKVLIELPCGRNLAKQTE